MDQYKTGSTQNSLLWTRLNPLFLFYLIIMLTFGSCAERTPQFDFTETDQGIGLTEAGDPVFYYQREPKPSINHRENYYYNNYFHPLYSLDGDTLTEEFPADHPHHRGIFWSWTQVYIGDQSVGSNWVMEHITHDIIEVNTSVQNNTARFDLVVHWKSSEWQNGQPFIHEQTSVVVHPREKEVRKIDFEIGLKALVPGVSIGGSDNVSGYGGFSPRIKTPEDLVFNSVHGQEMPASGQTEPSPWMDFTGSFGSHSDVSGLTLITHPDTPNYPPTWILNQENSMQNVVFPGRHRTDLPTDKPVILKYRLIVYGGKVEDETIDKIKADYMKK